MKKTNYCKIITGCLRGEQVKVGGQFWYNPNYDKDDTFPRNYPIIRFVGWDRNEGVFPLSDGKGGEIDLNDIAHHLLHKGVIINPTVSRDVLNSHSKSGISALMKKNMSVHSDVDCPEECPYLHEHHLLSKCHYHEKG